jgi:hypothetical protein
MIERLRRPAKPDAAAALPALVNGTSVRVAHFGELLSRRRQHLVERCVEVVAETVGGAMAGVMLHDEPVGAILKIMALSFPYTFSARSKAVAKNPPA